MVEDYGEHDESNNLWIELSIVGCEKQKEQSAKLLQYLDAGPPRRALHKGFRIFEDARVCIPGAERHGPPVELHARKVNKYIGWEGRIV